MCASMTDLFQMPRPDQWLVLVLDTGDGSTQVQTLYVGNVGFEPASKAPMSVTTTLRAIGSEMIGGSNPVFGSVLEHVERGEDGGATDHLCLDSRSKREANRDTVLKDDPIVVATALVVRILQPSTGHLYPQERFEIAQEIAHLLVTLIRETVRQMLAQRGSLE